MSKITSNREFARESVGKRLPGRVRDSISDEFQHTFDTEKVMRLLGAKQGQRVSSASLRRIDMMAEKVKGMLEPRLGYRIMGLSSTDRGGIQLTDGTCFKSPKLSRALSRAEAVCCFVTTVGPIVDFEIQYLMRQRRYAEAYILDAMGSMSVESVVEQFYQRMARRQAENRGGVTLRFSPGYCDWPIQEQRPLFKLFAKIDAPDVSLSDSCLMTPRKSVSGLFGLLPPGIQGVHPAYNPCHACGKRDCIARRNN